LPNGKGTPAGHGVWKEGLGRLIPSRGEGALSLFCPAAAFTVFRPGKWRPDFYGKAKNPFMAGSAEPCLEEEWAMATYKEIQEAKELLEKEGYLVRKATENLGRPYIGILSDLLEKEGYWMDEAMIERREDYSITGTGQPHYKLNRILSRKSGS
jgi:hypothetical protein